MTVLCALVALYPAVKWPALLTGVMPAEQVMLVAPGLIETPIWRKGLEAMHVDRLMVRVGKEKSPASQWAG